MKKLNITFLTLLCVVQVALVGCKSGTSSSRSTGEYVDDKEIKHEVKSAIHKDSILKSANINVESYRGIVQLTGFVDRQEQKDRATEIMRSIQGTKGLHNDIVVARAPYSEPAGSQPANKPPTPEPSKGSQPQ